MREGPDISIVAALIGNAACANMLMALMGGIALTATELANEAGIALPTASVHLAKLHKHHLLGVERQGRHRYFRLADAQVSVAIEALCPLAARAGHMRTRPGPRDAELRHARTCYDHLAGELAVGMLDGLVRRKVLARDGDGLRLTEAGRHFLRGRGVDIGGLERHRRPLCRACLDWSERRHHLGGALGAALLGAIEAQGWVARRPGTRIVSFRADGERRVEAWLAGEAPAARPAFAAG